MIEHVADLVSQKATDIAHEEIGKYSVANPEVSLNDSMKSLCVERAISQLSFKLNSFRNTTAESADDVDDLFEQWFVENEEDDLRAACRHCLEAEVKKLAKDEDPNLSWLDKFRRDHGKF